ncbi:MAG: hypothetical protein MUF62_02880 [Chitinophagaceae bacterium]|nr:hypothetical protein [Chitinophagaceae bacterium]
MNRRFISPRLARAAAASLLLAALALHSGQVNAAKGGGKEKKGFVLRFSGFDLKTPAAGTSLLQSGLHYRGSFSNFQRSPQQTTINSIITFQRGNTTFIYPYRHQVNVPRFKTPQKPAN